ncbi:MAG: helix-turn-helix domain-containing protein [Pyrinomonadaceae bacterium]
MASTLGEKLRQAREERGISISEVAEQTRISPQYLQSMENDDYKPLPGGIFNKGFLKSYARYVGYDEHEALQEYSQMVATAEASQDDEFKAYRPEVLTDEHAGASPLPTIIFAGVILTLMTVGLLYLVRYVINRPDSAPSVVTNANTNANLQSAAIETPAQPLNDSPPSMESVKVEFKTTSDPIWLSSISDGKSLVTTISADKPISFEPRQSLRLAYSKSLASAAQLTVNGRTIVLPQLPANPKRAAIEVEITRDNLGQVWQNSKIEALGSTAPAAAALPVRPAARPVKTIPAANTTAAPKTTVAPIKAAPAPKR